MGIFKDVYNKIANKKNLSIENKKALDIALANYFLKSLIAGGDEVNSFQGITFYKTIAPIYTAIDRISDEVAKISPHIYDIEKDKFVDDNFPKLNQLLMYPNANMTQRELTKSLSSFYLITGQNYIVATGNLKGEPNELFSINPQNVIIYSQINDLFPHRYEVVSGLKSSTSFNKYEDPKKGLLYINAEGEKQRQIWHMKTFNPASSAPAKFYGLSPLQGIYYEIQQHLQSSIHNYSSLLRGARLSGALEINGTLSEAQTQKLRQDLIENYEGSHNAGRLAILHGIQAKFIEMSKSNKDMDFRELKNDASNQIYTTLRIPLPLVKDSAMTMNNYKEARLAFYDDAVLPLANIMFDELTRFLFPRFNIDKSKYELRYDQSEIPTLESRRNENLKLMKELGVHPPDEIRAVSNYPPIKNGDVLYQPATLIPVGSVPQEPVTKPQEPVSKGYKQFYDIMIQYKDNEGNRLYSDEYIENMAGKNGLVKGEKLI